jgi:hypothetical protein
VVLGRVRRRFFRAGERLQSRTEVVVQRAAPLRRAARVGDVVERARGELDALADVKRRRSPPTFP